MKRNTCNIEFYCRQSRVDKNGYSAIEMSITINGNRKFFVCPRKERPEVFNRKRKPKDLQDYLDSMRMRFNGILTELSIRGEAITSDTIREYLRYGGYKPYTLENLCGDFLKLKKIDLDGGMIEKSHYMKYIYASNALMEYLGKDKEVGIITPADMQMVYARLRSKFVASSSAGYMTKIKAIIKYAWDNGKLTVNPCQNIKINKGTPNLDTISTEDLLTIINKEFASDRINKVRDIFVFACGSGLAYCDCARLTPEDFSMENGHLCIVKDRKKTGSTFCSVLLPCAVAIANKYNMDFSKIISSNQKTNEYLKEIQEACGIKNITLTFHKARHYYCHHLVNSGVRIETVAFAAGHKTTKTTLKYYAKVEVKTAVNEIGNIV